MTTTERLPIFYLAELGDAAARAALERAGYVILDTPDVMRSDVLDFVARDRDGVLVFVDVQTRKTGTDSPVMFTQRHTQWARVAGLEWLAAPVL